MARETAVVVCPGRGTYGAEELGYLMRRHGGKTAFLAAIDADRTAHGREPVTQLDARERYAAGVHAVSENASALIYACALGDFADIDRDRFDIVAVTGNSLGWYLALAAAGALDPAAAITLVDTMGVLMAEHGVGGQLVAPIVDETWVFDPVRAHRIDAALAAANAVGGRAYVSIRLGGMLVLAGDEPSIGALEAALPAEGRFPMRLARHAAFHTPLLAHLPPLARAALPAAMFGRPRVPLIDGTGRVWSPYGTDLSALYDYTLGKQIETTYDFSKCIEVALKEFAPDRLIILGPGSTLGAPIAQEAIRHGWRGLANKADFQALQLSDPFVLAMGLDAQRARVTGAADAAVPV